MHRLPKGLADLLPPYWPTIHEAVSESLRTGWKRKKPSLLVDTDPLTEALGTGLWGVAYKAAPEWCVKITTDEREAVAFHDICVKYDESSMRQHPGVAYLADAWQLEDQTRSWEYSSYSNYTVYVLLCELVTPIESLLGAKECEALNAAMWPARQVAIDYDHALGSSRASAHQLDDLRNAVRLELAKVKRLRPELWDVGEFSAMYLNTTDFALADVHTENIGRKPSAEGWCSFDLGHPTTTGPHPKQPLFKVLRP